MPESAVLIIVIAVVLVFEFVNGWNDSANAIATVVSTKVLTPLKAVFMAATLDFAGALVSTRVAKTILDGIVDRSCVEQGMVLTAVLAAVLAAGVWVAMCTLKGLPISGSHSLIGGVVGAFTVAAGVSVLRLHGIGRILVALVVSPFVGLSAGFLIMLCLLWICRLATPSGVNSLFGKLQVLSASFVAMNHGANDAQKGMGIITMALVAGGWQQEGTGIKTWVIFACAAVMGLGIYVGGWRVIKTLGHGLMKLQPVHGFSAETAASLVIASASALGLPVSTTHCITGSIMGVGATRGFRTVRWGLGKKIAYAWLFTLPGCAVMAGAIYLLLSWLS